MAAGQGDGVGFRPAHYHGPDGDSHIAALFQPGHQLVESRLAPGLDRRATAFERPVFRSLVEYGADLGIGGIAEAVLDPLRHHRRHPVGDLRDAVEGDEQQRGGGGEACDAGPAALGARARAGPVDVRAGEIDRLRDVLVLDLEPLELVALAQTDAEDVIRRIEMLQPLIGPFRDQGVVGISR
jgi:hypothetical protein